MFQILKANRARRTKDNNLLKKMMALVGPIRSNRKDLDKESLFFQGRVDFNTMVWHEVKSGKLVFK